jgi:undecaprenyl diphosphate synthase
VHVPRHVAIIMDGNGRWARQRGMPRVAGHRSGLKAVRLVIDESIRHGIGVLTLFAFSTENWARPEQEVGVLMGLFFDALEREVDRLDEQGVAMRFVGARDTLPAGLQERMLSSEQRTAHNTKLILVIAVAYGGRADIVGAARRLAAECAAGQIAPGDIDETRFAGALGLAGLPDPDLFIRTGGDVRISNFLLWNLAYTELWFTDTYWPAFDAAEFERAIDAFRTRERRFGKTSQQIGNETC